jgi:uncharacterized protein YecE (DUF72 family)
MRAVSKRKSVAVRVGTCGYSYKDWIGPVYPNGTKPIEMLDLYARQFVTVEIDATYYRVPGAATFDSMARRTPDGFRFTAKLPSAGTHLPDPGTRRVHDDVALFRKNIAPLVDAGKFACVLAQFPTSFRPNDATRSHLEMLREALGNLGLVVEFRHREWQTNETLELLRAIGVGLVNVDEPHFKTLPRESSDVTSSIAYVRFHGRNAANWWRGTNVTRYDYSYGTEELEPWVHRLTDIAADPNVREVYAYFNNHARGQAVRSAELFENMLRGVLPPETLRAAPREQAEASRSLELPLGDLIT